MIGLFVTIGLLAQSAPLEVPLSTVAERIEQGLAVGEVSFEDRFIAAELLRATRDAQEAGVGLWANRREAAPLLDAHSLRRKPPGAIRGVALPMHSLLPDYDYSRELSEIAALGADWVSLQFVTLQDRVDSSEVPNTSERTPNDACILGAIRRARALGLEVLLLPIVLIRNPGPEDWRGTLAPSTREQWWATYSNFVLHTVDLAAEAGASAVSLGSELASLEEDEQRWKLLIVNARLRFGGLLTYSSNWDHFDRVEFWRELDFAGMTAYFELHDGADPTLAELENGWRHAASEMQRLSRHAHLPVLFTEVGIPSLKGAAGAPWDYTARGEVDLEMQRRAFRAFGKVFLCASADRERFLGMLLYDWWGEGGESDTSYTARGKPAEKVWRELLR